MVKLTEDMIVARTRYYLSALLPGIYGVLLTRVGDLASVKRLNCWGADLDDVSVLRRLENVEVIALSLNSIASLADFQHCKQLQDSASKSSIRRFIITEKAPTRAFSWLKAATTAFTFKTLLRHYARRALTPWSLNVKLGLRPTR